MKVASERKLAVLRALGGKNVNKRLPSALRNAEGHRVEDQSRWGSLIHEHFQGKFRRENVQKPETTRVFWKMKVCEALQRGQNPEELSYEEFLEVLRLVKPNVATGRDNVPGTILRFMPESVQSQLYRAIVERLAGREDAHVKGWAELDICLVPKKGDISKLSNWRPISLVPTLYKCMKCACGKSWTKNLDPFRINWWGLGLACSVLTSSLFWWKVCAKQTNGEKLFVVSMDVASAFDSVSAQVLGDVLLERGATTISAAAAVRENLELRARPFSGFTKSASFSLDVGMRQGGQEHLQAGTRSWRCLSRNYCNCGSVGLRRCLGLRNGCRLKFWCGLTTYSLSPAPSLTYEKKARNCVRLWEKRFAISSLEILPSKVAEREATRILLNEGMEFSWVRILVVLGCYLVGSGSKS